MASRMRPDINDPHWLFGRKCADIMNPMKTTNIMGMMKKL